MFIVVPLYDEASGLRALSVLFWKAIRFTLRFGTMKVSQGLGYKISLSVLHCHVYFVANKFWVTIFLALNSYRWAGKDGNGENKG